MDTLGNFKIYQKAQDFSIEIPLIFARMDDLQHFNIGWEVELKIWLYGLQAVFDRSQVGLNFLHTCLTLK